MVSEDVVIVGGARTPFCEWQGGKRGDGKPGGLLKDTSALKLGEIAIRGALDKTGTSPKDIDHVVMGYALQTCDQAIFGARHAGLGADIPQGSPYANIIKNLWFRNSINNYWCTDDNAWRSFNNSFRGHGKFISIAARATWNERYLQTGKTSKTRYNFGKGYGRLSFF